MVKITDQIRWLIVDRMQNGLSQSDVSKQLEIGQTTVRKIWLKFVDTGSIDNRPRSGRPMKTTIRERRSLCRLSKKDPFKTSNQLHQDSNLTQTISARTVRRVLNKSNLFGRCAAKKPLLNKVQIKKRLSYAKAYKLFSKEQWGAVIFFR